MPERSIFVRLSVKDAEQAAAALRRFGVRGEQALQRIERATRGSSRGLQLVDRAAVGLRGNFQQLAASAALVDGPLGSVSGRINTFGALLGRVNPLVAGLTVGLAGAAAGFAQLVRRGAELERSQFRIEALLRATGGASGRTAEQLDELAVSLGRNTLASVQGARQAAASLLTFRSVSRDVFDDTLRLAQDLAAAGFGTLETNVIQLGKALEDPAQGLTALRRVGVSFTEQQREQIKALNEAGQAAEAQRIILGTLEDQVGGAGEGEAGGLSGAYDTLTENIGLFFEAANRGTGTTEKLAGTFEILARGVERATEAIAGGSIEDRLRAINERIVTISREQNALINPILGEPLPQNRERFETLERRFEELKAEQAEIGRTIELREQQEAQAAAAAAAAEERRQKDIAAAKAKAEADKATAQAEKARDRERASALRELEQLEGKVTTAGLSGVALLEAQRDEAIEKFRERLEERLISEEEFNRARLAAEETFQREKTEIETRAQERLDRQRERKLEREAEKRERAAERAAERQAEALRRPFEDALDDTRDAFRDFFEDILDDGKLSFESLADALRGTFTSALSALAQQQAGSFFGGARSPGGTTIGGITTLFGGGSLASSFLPSGGGAAADIGVLPTLGGATNAAASGFNFGGLLTAVGLGAGGGGLLGGLFGGQGSTGGTIGGGLGAGAGFAIGGPIGGLIGGLVGSLGGGGLGSLFGGGNKRPNATTDLLIRDGRFAVGTTDVDNDADPRAVQQLANQFVQGVNALIDAFGLTAQRGRGVLLAGFNTRSNLDQETLGALIRQATRGGFLTGPGSFGTVLRGTDALDFETLAEDLQIAQLVEQFAEGGTQANGLKVALEEIGEEFDRMRARAIDLGISVERASEAFEKAERQQVEALLGDVRAFQASLQTGPLAQASPAERFATARGLFDELAGRARGGDLDAIAAFPSQAQGFLNFARSLFASGPEFQQVFRDVNEVLDSILNVGGFQGGGSFIVPGSGPPDSRTILARVSPGEEGRFRTPAQRSGDGEILRQVGAAQVRGTAAVVQELQRNRQATERLIEEIQGLRREGRQAGRMQSERVRAA